MSIRPIHGLDPILISLQPTADVASIIQTGLSKFRRIRVEAFLQLTDSGASLTAEMRVTGGTYRTVGATGTTAAVDRAVSMVLEVSNHGKPTSKISHYWQGVLAAGIDASDGAALVGIDDGFRYDSHDAEIWDELRLVPSAGSIEGSTADARGRVFIWGWR